MAQRFWEACSRDYVAEESDSDSEARWDQAISSGANRAGHRALCDCGRPLRRQTRLPYLAAFLACGTSAECERCSETIWPGDMHFTCPSCEEVKICKNCGPGVYIDRSYDYYNAATRERRVQSMPANALHVRIQKHRAKRGATLETDSAVLEIASFVEHQVSAIQARVGAQEDMLDEMWDKENLLFLLLGVETQQDAAQRIIALVSACQDIVMFQPILTEASVPCKVYGDIHGQFRDLIMLFHAFGVPRGLLESPTFVFNGDFVDRGRHQLEVLVTLCAQKVLYPNNVFLNRGNHEDQTMNAKYGFEAACYAQLGPTLGRDVFKACSALFTYLPLGCLIAGKILAVHGGIGDGKWLINDLKKVQRPLGHNSLLEKKNRWLWNILWSDPIEDDLSDSSAAVFGVHVSPRSKSAVKFGWNVTQAFCAKNGLDLVVRSHQSKKGSLGFDVMHNESLIRVFSARDYEHNRNDGAVLLITGDEHDVLTVRSQVLASYAKTVY